MPLHGTDLILANMNINSLKKQILPVSASKIKINEYKHLTKN